MYYKQINSIYIIINYQTTSIDTYLSNYNHTEQDDSDISIEPKILKNKTSNTKPKEDFFPNNEKKYCNNDISTDEAIELKYIKKRTLNII